MTDVSQIEEKKSTEVVTREKKSELIENCNGNGESHHGIYTVVHS